MNKSVPVISLLAPEHVGLTLQEQPVSIGSRLRSRIVRSHLNSP